MTLVIIGGTGLIGAKVVSTLRRGGYPALAASPDSGVNSITGEGLDQALAGAAVVVDASNSPSFEGAVAMDYFHTSTRNLLAAGRNAGVTHYVALSVVGTERIADSGYFRAKVAQERLIQASGIPFTIVHATQLFEFIDRIAGGATEGPTVRVPPVLVQPRAADDVADAVARVAVAYPVNGIVEVAARADPARHAAAAPPRRSPRSAHRRPRRSGPLLWRAAERTQPGAGRSRMAR